MKTEALKQALDKYQFDAAFGGARRDEEKSRAKERVFSFRDQFHRWDPKNQRPELWNLYNARVNKGESIRVFPLSNWTELDVWQYIHLEQIPIVPLYFAAPRPVVRPRRGLIHGRRRPDAAAAGRDSRRSKWCGSARWAAIPLTGAVVSDATTLPEIIQEMLLCTTSERQGRVIDNDDEGSMEDKKREGYISDASDRRLMPHQSDLIATDIHAYLAQHERKELLRFLTCGSVDDGKSTLIGRLFYDAKLIYEDQLRTLERDSPIHGTTGGGFDPALYTDGLKAEREQGITIDVAYRYFSTARRKFIIADTPGPRAVHAEHGHRARPPATWRSS